MFHYHQSPPTHQTFQFKILIKSCKPIYILRITRTNKFNNCEETEQKIKLLSVMLDTNGNTLFPKKYERLKIFKSGALSGKM